MRYSVARNDLLTPECLQLLRGVLNKPDATIPDVDGYFDRTNSPRRCDEASVFNSGFRKGLRYCQWSTRCSICWVKYTLGKVYWAVSDLVKEPTPWEVRTTVRSYERQKFVNLVHLAKAKMRQLPQDENGLQVRSWSVTYADNKPKLLIGTVTFRPKLSGVTDVKNVFYEVGRALPPPTLLWLNATRLPKYVPHLVHYYGWKERFEEMKKNRNNAALSCREQAEAVVEEIRQLCPPKSDHLKNAEDRLQFIVKISEVVNPTLPQLRATEKALLSITAIRDKVLAGD